MAPEWFEEWFGEEYVKLYPHRNETEAARAVALIAATTSLQPGWRVLDLACGAGRHMRALRARGACCIGLDLSMTLLKMAQRTAGASTPLVRADMRQLPIRPYSMDLTASLFTSFGYFERDEEQVATIQEMASTVRPGGWLVIDFLNPDTVRRDLVPHEVVALDGGEVTIARALSADGRFVRKSIRMPSGREFLERVRLFSAEQIAGMLAAEGIVVRHRFGDYDGGPLGERAPRAILFGQAVEGTGR